MGTIFISAVLTQHETNRPVGHPLPEEPPFVSSCHCSIACLRDILRVVFRFVFLMAFWPHLFPLLLRCLSRLAHRPLYLALRRPDAAWASAYGSAFHLQFPERTFVRSPHVAIAMCSIPQARLLLHVCLPCCLRARESPSLSFLDVPCYVQFRLDSLRGETPLRCEPPRSRGRGRCNAHLGGLEYPSFLSLRVRNDRRHVADRACFLTGQCCVNPLLLCEHIISVSQVGPLDTTRTTNGPLACSNNP